MNKLIRLALYRVLIIFTLMLALFVAHTKNKNNGTQKTSGLTSVNSKDHLSDKKLVGRMFKVEEGFSAVHMLVKGKVFRVELINKFEGNCFTILKSQYFGENIKVLGQGFLTAEINDEGEYEVRGAVNSLSGKSMQAVCLESKTQTKSK